MQKNLIAEAYLTIISEATGKTINAKDHPLYQKRDASTIDLKSDNDVQKALDSDATSVRIKAKKHSFNDGDKTGVRLNINVLKNTKVPVLTMHSPTNKDGYKKNKGFYNGEAKEYRQTATLHNAYFNVHQPSRERIASKVENKHPMASVDGDVRNVEPNFDGVEARFNPMNNHLFVDGNGNAIRSAEHVTLHGHRAYLRGKIEYHTKETAPEKSGTAPSTSTLSEELNSLVEFYSDYKEELNLIENMNESIIDSYLSMIESSN
jgi:hypothetical protein